MSYPPQQPYRPPTAPRPQQASTGWAPPPAKRRSALPWILGIAGGVLTILIGLAALGAVLEPSADNASATGTPTSAGPAKITTPAAADFKLTAKITEQTCYGEAGCSTTWLPMVTYTGPAIPAGETWIATYEVTGIESGTKVGKIVVGSIGPAKQTEKRGRTADEDKKITLKVTRVERG